MIKNTNDIQEYTNMNKIYIPNEYINNNYNYKISGDYITIITNLNCNQQYNTTYCTCYNYNFKENIVSESYNCSTNNNNPTINRTYITNDINYSEPIRTKFYQDKTMILIIVILGILFAKFLTKERKHV